MFLGMRILLSVLLWLGRSRGFGPLLRGWPYLLRWPLLLLGLRWPLLLWGRRCWPFLGIGRTCWTG
jgi:hypothetical protein